MAIEEPKTGVDDAGAAPEAMLVDQDRPNPENITYVSFS